MVTPVVDERTFTVAEVAARLRVTEYTVREWLNAAKIRGYRPGGRRAGWRVRAADLERFIERRMNECETC